MVREGRFAWTLLAVAGVCLCAPGLGIQQSEASSSVGQTTTYPGISNPHGITAGLDGALWFTNSGNNSIGRITTGGKVKTVSDPSIATPLSITAGLDGALWFTNYGNDSIGRITVRGSVTASTAPGVVKPEFIAPGSDGALWFTNFAGTIARITEKPAAHISLSASSGPPASEVTVSGASFGAFEHVKILFADSTNGTTTLATVLTDAAGRFSAVVTIPAGASSGSQHIKAKGLASALHASRAFTVT